jgi:hypothetical protein
MVDQLSMAKAMGQLELYQGTPIWDLYLKGHAAQLAIEAELEKTLIAEGKGREHVVEKWMQSSTQEVLSPELLAAS